MQVTRAQWPDPEHSQDRVYATDHAAIVLDGASPFVPVEVRTDHYVETLGTHLAAALQAAPTRDLAKVVAEAITATADALQLTAGGSPSSTISIARARNDVVDLYALGDSTIYYGNEQTTLTLTDARIAELGIPEHHQYRQRLADGHGYDATHRELLQRLQQQQRQQRNQPGGYWIAETNPAAAHHAYTTTVATTDITWAVLATDGAYGPITHLGLDNWHHIAQLDTADLKELLKRCADWETTADPNGHHYPRSKVSDDKTLAAITFTSS